LAEIILIDEFVDRFLKDEIPLLDARSEGEYLRGHIPGALNLPLLKNEERVVIGTTYKQQGREAAVKKGFELVGPRFASIIADAEKLAPSRDILLYCWRGGMRSNITAWLLNLSGFRVTLLKNGYKAWRTWAQAQFNIKGDVIVAGGRTGSGKTSLLKAIAACGEPVIDLEGMACHKGSAFGALGQQPQPVTEHFENMLAIEWFVKRKKGPVWMENESRSIGSNIIPLGIYEQLRNASMIEIRLPDALRKQRILDEYGIFPTEKLAENTLKLAKRLGGNRLKEAMACLDEKNLAGWVDLMLSYYDESYLYGNTQRDQSKITAIEFDHDRMDENAAAVIELMKKKELINFHLQNK